MAASTRTGDAAVSHAAPLAGTDEGVGWRGLVAVVVASRLVVVAAALVAELFVPRNPLLTGGDGAPILESLTSWDGWWYLGIVRDGGGNVLGGSGDVTGGTRRTSSEPGHVAGADNSSRRGRTAKAPGQRQT